MRTPLKATLVTVLPLASLLWLTPPADAHDSYRSHTHRRSWSEPQRYPYSGRYSDWGRQQRYNSWEYGRNQRKYDKAMNRLARQEHEARTRAYRRYGEGDISDRRYRRRLAEIDRKYDHKRDKVERNWGYGR